MIFAHGDLSFLVVVSFMLAVPFALAWSSFGRTGPHVGDVVLGYRDREGCRTLPLVGADQRVGRLAEYLEILRGLYANERLTLRGRYYTLDDASLVLRQPKCRSG
jgi:hypothetical protein